MVYRFAYRILLPLIVFTSKLFLKKIHDLTGLTVSMHDCININADEEEWSVYIDKKEFEEVLHVMALSSAAVFVDRFHKVIDSSAVYTWTWGDDIPCP